MDNELHKLNAWESYGKPNRWAFLTDYVDVFSLVSLRKHKEIGA